MTDNMFDDEEIEAAPVPTSDGLASVQQLATSIIKGREYIAALDASRATAAARLRELEESELPKAMIDHGLTDFGLVGGGRVELKTEYYASITKAMRTKAHKWLTANDHGDLVKRALKFAFPRGSNKVAMLLDFAKEHLDDIKLTDTEAVHPQTLGAFVREQIKEGNIAEGDEGFQLLGVFTKRYADVTLPGAAAGGSKSKARKPSNDEEDDE